MLALHKIQILCAVAPDRSLSALQHYSPIEYLHNPHQNFMRVLGRILSGTTGLVSVVVGHYYIGLVLGRGGLVLDWFREGRSTTGFDTTGFIIMHYWIGYPRPKW